MKKLSKEQRVWHKYYSKTKHIKELKRKEKWKSNDANHNNINDKIKIINEKFIKLLLVKFSCLKKFGNKVSLNLPENFDLESSYNSTIIIIQAFREINEFEFKNKCRILVKIFFERLEYLSTSACILLSAEIDTWRNKNNVSLRVDTKQWNAQVLNQLNQLGFFVLLNCPVDDNRIAQRNIVNFLKFESYNAADNSINTGDLIVSIRSRIEKMIGSNLPVLSQTNFFRAVSESILNVQYHAYPVDKNKPWWLTSSYDSTKRELRIVFCDRGITIPKSMEVSEKGKKILEQIKNTTLWNHDSHRIKKAMQIGGTSSSEIFRGNGLHCFRGFVNEGICGKLHIVSGKGYYMFSSEDNTEISSEKRVNLKGTIITWSVRF